MRKSLKDLPEARNRVMRMLEESEREYLSRWAAIGDCRRGRVYLRVNHIDHMHTKAQSPLNNGICERVRRTILKEFYQIVRLALLVRTNPLEDKWISLSG
jgi:hypothetical protein